MSAAQIELDLPDEVLGGVESFFRSQACEHGEGHTSAVQIPLKARQMHLTDDRR